MRNAVTIGLSVVLATVLGAGLASFNTPSREEVKDINANIGSVARTAVRLELAMGRLAEQVEGLTRAMSGTMTAPEVRDVIRTMLQDGWAADRDKVLERLSALEWSVEQHAARLSAVEAKMEKR